MVTAKFHKVSLTAESQSEMDETLRKIYRGTFGFPRLHDFPGNARFQAFIIREALTGGIPRIRELLFDRCESHPSFHKTGPTEWRRIAAREGFGLSNSTVNVYVCKMRNIWRGSVGAL